jgi:hypothetical protein
MSFSAPVAIGKAHCGRFPMGPQYGMNTMISDGSWSLSTLATKKRYCFNMPAT